MGAFSIWHWVIVLAVVLVLFGGKGKISALMGDFGKGLKSFKKGMKDDEGEKAEGSEDAPKLSGDKTETVDQSASEEKKSG
ncbi:MAG: twin-arginine translocase TatA/TatE family subunit [Rhodospirillales bacterium]|nr:twin-arginine translocase TatA/TatE family subunit [Rhodospirillales bacterium]